MYGTELKKFRIKNKLSQKDLGEKIGFRQHAISLFENDEREISRKNEELFKKELQLIRYQNKLIHISDETIVGFSFGIMSISAIGYWVYDLDFVKLNESVEDENTLLNDGYIYVYDSEDTHEFHKEKYKITIEKLVNYPPLKR